MNLFHRGESPDQTDPPYDSQNLKYMPGVFARGGSVPGSFQRLFFFLFITLDAGPERPLSLELSSTKVYNLQIRVASELIAYRGTSPA